MGRKITHSQTWYVNNQSLCRCYFEKGREKMINPDNAAYVTRNMPDVLNHLEAAKAEVWNMASRFQYDGEQIESDFWTVYDDIKGIIEKCKELQERVYRC
jgi:hypothetical protein